MSRALPLLLLLLAACGTPQERCIRGATGDLRSLDRLIAEAEGNLSRGYALEATTVYRTYWAPCGYDYSYGYARGGGMCLREQPVIIERPKSIDLQEEARKLAQLKTTRAEANRTATAAITQCKASFPE